MSSGPVRRVAWALLLYAVVALLVVRMADWLQRVLALPPLFRTLGAVLLVAVVPLTVVVAWRYPELGASPSEEGRGADRSESPGG